MEKFLERKFKFLPEKKRAIVVFSVDILINVLIIVISVFIIRTYIFSLFQVYGGSMCNTINFSNNECNYTYGEYLMVNKAAYGNFFGWKIGTPQRGDIIVTHRPPDDEEFIIKRVIGLPGETVKLKDGFVYIYNQEYPQGIKLDEPYLNAVNLGNTLPAPGETDTFTVPADRYFVMGDNRTRSSDSRACFATDLVEKPCSNTNVSPYLKPGEIEGKAWLVLWPLSKMSILKNGQYNP